MIGKQNDKENIDILGVKWILAPGGKEVVDQCQTEVSDLRYEVCALGSLFRNLASHDFSDEELYGIGLVLEKISERLGTVFDDVGKSITRVEENDNEK